MDLLECFWILVSLHNPSVLQLKVTNWLPEILMQPFFFIRKAQLMHPPITRSLPDPGRLDGMLLFSFFFYFSGKHNFYVCLVRPLNVFQKNLEIILDDVKGIFRFLFLSTRYFAPLQWVSFLLFPICALKCASLRWVFSPFVQNGSHCGSWLEMTLALYFICFQDMMNYVLRSSCWHLLHAVRQDF